MINFDFNQDYIKISMFSWYVYAAILSHIQIRQFFPSL